MALTCPKCDKSNNANFHDSESKENMVIIDYQNDLYQCCHCNHKFDEQDSLDHDWNKLMEKYYTEITPEMCLEWLVLWEERKKLETTYGKFGYEVAFKYHFGISYRDCDQKTFQKLKIQVNRDKILNNLIDETKKSTL